MNGIHTYGEVVHLFVQTRKLSRDVHAEISQVEVEFQSARDRLAICRSLRSQRRLESDESVGEALPGREAVPKHSDLRRQGDFHLILHAHQQSDEQSKRFHEFSDQ